MARLTVESIAVSLPSDLQLKVNKSNSKLNHKYEVWTADNRWFSGASTLVDLKISLEEKLEVRRLTSEVQEIAGKDYTVQRHDGQTFIIVLNGNQVVSGIVFADAVIKEAYRIRNHADKTQRQRNEQLFQECHAAGIAPSLEGTLAEDEEAMGKQLVARADYDRQAINFERVINSVPSGVGFGDKRTLKNTAPRKVERRAARFHAAYAA